MKQNVLQLIGSFHQGGSERQAVQLTRLLHEDDTYKVFAACLNRDGILYEEIEKLGLGEIPEYKLTSFYNANMVHQIKRCAKFLRENDKCGGFSPAGMLKYVNSGVSERSRRRGQIRPPVTSSRASSETPC